MEELKSKLQQEANRREIFERKNAELEMVNDNLRCENDVSSFIDLAGLGLLATQDSVGISA